MYGENYTLNYAMHNPKNGLFVFVIEGMVELDGRITLERRDAAALEETENTAILAKTDAQILCIEVPMH